MRPISGDSRSLDHGPREPALPDTTIGGALTSAAQRFGQREAVVSLHQDIRFTYAQLDRETDSLARGLLRSGISKGDRVALWSQNCAEWVVVQYATARIGAVLVTVNPAFRTNELAFVLQQSGARLLISASEFKGSDFRAMAAEAAPGLDTVFFGTPGWQALRQPGEEPLTALDIRPEEAVNIQYTSGTTGLPKGATLSHRNILGNGAVTGAVCRYTERDRICVPVPFYHCFGMVLGNLAALVHGACVVMPAAAFDPAATLAAIESEGCTSVYGVPTMFIAMLADPGFAETDLSSVRTGILAGAPCPVEVMKQVQAFMREVTICYGMTETSPVSTQTRHDDDLDRRVSTVGRVHPHVTVKIADPATGRAVPRGEQGELCTAGYGVMLGYWDEPVRTAEAVDQEGFMHTGDLAVMDADGYVSIVGRSKDVVIRGGENIYPREIEEFLHGHPEIRDVQVVGVPDPRTGEEVCAWVQLAPGSSLDAEGLREWCRGRLAQYKIPRYVRVTDDFPMTVTGKVQKFRMKEISAAELGLSQSDLPVRGAE